ncbi:MAG: response regulator [Methanosarcinaceae archaeon]|nr:response regulator [Methanosarcinaceae archaeon]
MARKKILIVDDEPEVVELVNLMLDQEDYDLVSADSGLKCLEIIDNENIDAILLDIMMPDMDGWETFHKIKQKDPTMPIAILTATCEEFDRMMGLKVLKAEDYVTKPFDRKQLLGCIHGLLND